MTSPTKNFPVVFEFPELGTSILKNAVLEESATLLDLLKKAKDVAEELIKTTANKKAESISLKNVKVNFFTWDQNYFTMSLVDNKLKIYTNHEEHLYSIDSEKTLPKANKYIGLPKIHASVLITKFEKKDEKKAES